MRRLILAGLIPYDSHLQRAAAQPRAMKKLSRAPEYLAAGGAPPHPPLGVTTNGSDKGSLASGLFFFFKVFVSMARLALRIYYFVRLFYMAVTFWNGDFRPYFQGSKEFFF